MKKEKNVLMQIDNVRVVEYDSLNVKIERFEKVINKREGKEIDKWTFKGYSKSIMTALEAILRNELLIDKNSVSNLESYLNEVRRSNEEIKRAIAHI